MIDLDDRLASSAADVLRGNDRGGRTVAAPLLYPHQWSWDAAFVSIGWATISVPRALEELRNLLRGQWATGMIPHIVFSEAPGYFPGPERWRTERAAAAPPGVKTSGICQPAVHSVALEVIAERAVANGGEDLVVFDAFLRETFTAWFRWHQWLDRVRGTHPCGLLEIHHGWESGMDNSPRWDAAYDRVAVGPMAPYTRQDLQHVASVGQRPADADYDRYIWLVEQLVSVDYDDDAARQTVSFRVGDVFFTAVHAVGAQVLADLGERIGRTDEVAELRRMAADARAGVEASICPITGLARDYDIRAEEWLEAETIGGFAPLIAGTDPQRYAQMLATLLGERWCASPLLHAALPTTTSPASPAFVQDNYWRGPQWPVVGWLLSWVLDHHGHPEPAEQLRQSGLAQLADQNFAEYYDARDGRALGSMSQSWTAAVALDWLADRRSATS